MATITNNIRWADNTAELKQNLLSGIGTLDAMKSSVDRTVASLSGQGLFQAANKAAAAVQQLGDVTKLTGAEQDRISGLLDKAIEKYGAMGMKAPPAMLEIRDSIEAARHAGDDWTVTVAQMFEHPLDAMKAFGSTFQSSVVQMLGPTLGPVAEVAVVALSAVGAGLIDVGTNAEMTGSSIAKLAMVTGGTVAGLSDLTFALNSTGGATDDLGNVMFQFEQRMVNSTDKVDTGLKMIGLSMGEIEGLSGDQQILLISDAFRAAGDDVNKAAAAMDIFGKQGKTILPSLMQPLSDLAGKSKELGITWGQDDANAAHDFEVAQKTLQTTTTGTWTAIGRDVAPVTDKLVLGYERMKLAIANVAYDVLQLATGFGYVSAAWQVFVSGVDHGSEVVESALDKMKTAKDRAFDEAHSPDKEFEKWKKSVQDYVGAAPSMEDALDTQTTAGQYLTDEVSESIKKHDEYVKQVSAVVDALEGETGKTLQTVDAVHQIIDSGTKNNDVIQRTVDAIDKLSPEVKRNNSDLLAWADANRVIKGTIDALHGPLSELSVPIVDNTRHLDEARAAFDDARDSIDNLTAYVNEFHDGITTAGDTLSTVIIPAFSTLPNVVAQNTNEIRTATDATEQWTDVFKKFPDLLTAAFTGGGGLTGALKGFSNEISKSIFGKDGPLSSITSGVASTVTSATGFLGSTVSKMFGSVASSVLPGLGGLISSGLGMIFSAFGPSQAELDGRKIESAFEQSFGGFDGMMAAVGKAYAAMGKTADQAQSDVKGLLDAEKQGPQATQEWLDKINAVVTAANNLGAKGSTAATQFGAAFKVPADALASYDKLNQQQMDLSAQLRAGNLSTQQRVSLQQQLDTTMSQLNIQMGILDATMPKTEASANAMADSVVADFAGMLKNGVSFTDAVKNISPSITALETMFAGMGDTVTDVSKFGGAAFRQLKGFVDLTSDAIAGPALNSVQSLIGGMKTLDQMGLGNKQTYEELSNQIGVTFNSLVKQGKDGDTVMIAMRDQIQTVWEEQQKYGLVLDDSTQKLVDQAVQQGIVGPQMEDVNKQLLKVMTDIDDVLRGMSGHANDFAGAINSMPTSKTITITTDYVSSGSGPSPDSSYASAGGLVTSRGVQYFGAGGSVLPFTPRGTDTVPAMLTPGEGVVSRRGMSVIGRQGLAAINRGGDQAAAPAVDTSAIRAMHSELQGVRSDLRDAMESMPRRMRDVVRLAS